MADEAVGYALAYFILMLIAMLMMAIPLRVLYFFVTSPGGIGAALSASVRSITG